MHSLFAGIHVKDKTSEFLPLNKIDFEKTDVLHLKQEIAKKLDYDANKLELIYNGTPLNDELKLAGLVRPNATVHCFTKTEKYKPYEPTEIDHSAVQALFNVIAHIQINVNSRMNILHKILAEYPEFRRNLGAQALIRDSVLFNTLHQPEVTKRIAENYPIICEAASFIVDTIKKELTRSTSTTNFSEPATDSTNSSEEENSLGATGSSTANENPSTAGGQQSDNIRLISRQQLQAALAQIGVGGSHNSLSNIAQRNSDSSSTGGAASTAAAGSAPLSTSASGDRISSEVFRNQLQIALNTLQRVTGTRNGVSSTTAPSAVQEMDTTEVSQPTEDTSMNAPSLDTSAADTSSGEIPAYYRTHQYAEQLNTMAQMGFVNYDENLTYLNITNGNIESAINLLVGSMN